MPEPRHPIHADPLFLWPPRRRDHDRAVLGTAAGIAAAVHLAVLVLPIEFDRAELPAEPPRSTLTVHEWVPRAPEVRPPDRTTVASAEHLVPVPATEPERLFEPVAEASPAPTVDAPFDVVDLPVPDGPAPSPSLAVLDANAPGVAPPSRLPGGDEPRYPEIARRVGASGRVVLSAVIDPAGRVVDVVVVDAPTPDLGFSEAAVEAVRTWTYRPGMWRGRPRAVRLTVTVTFTAVR